MSRGVFNSQNKVVTYWDFQTNASSATTFTPIMLSGSKRVSWDLGDVFYRAGSSISYVFSGGSSVKDCRTISRYNGEKVITGVNFDDDKLVGELNMSGFTNMNYLQYSNNPGLTSIILPKSGVLSQIFGNGSGTIPQNISGIMDLSSLTGLTNLQIPHNPKVTGIINPVTNSNVSYYAFNQNGSYPVTGITGTLNMTGLTNQSGFFDGPGNINMTKVLSPITNGVFYFYNLTQCNITGNHDISGLNNLGGNFYMGSNPNLTAVTHCYSPQIFTQYYINNGNLTGNHDLTMLPNLGGTFQLYTNPNLTSVTHTASTQIFSSYNLLNCNITGNHDLTMLPNLGGAFDMGNNINLTGVTHTASTQIFSSYLIYNTSLTGTHDISMLSNMSGIIRLYNNTGLTNTILPFITGGTFTNDYEFINTPPYLFPNPCLKFDSNNLGYIDFKVLSAATMNVNSTYGASIDLYSNNLTATEINHILTDFDWIVSNNLNRWSGVTLDILIGNSTPDTTSGGYDGVAAINSLTGSPKNWIIV